MTGNILEIFNGKGAGLITGTDNNTYYFASRDLQNCSRYQIEEGDFLEFDVVKPTPGKKHCRAVRIRKKSVSVSNSIQSKINVGKNPTLRLDHFNSDEKHIIDLLSKTFYVTNGGSVISVGGSTYKYCLIKPTPYFTTMFHLSRELVVVFSDYIAFEPRSLDAASVVMKKIESRLRLERCCHVLISNDSQIETRIVELLKDTNLNSIIIPFSYYEFINNSITDAGIKDRFKKHLFDVDLFSESKPIENDLFFFGRRDYAQDIATKCKCNSHCGVFGLRRSGKTSLLYAVRRLLQQEDYLSTYIPCNSEIANLDWSSALYRIVKDVHTLTGIKATLHTEDDYVTSGKAAICFEEDLNVCLSTTEKPVTLMFDEIEYITFNSVIATDTWKSGCSFIPFWNAIRGYCLKYPNNLSIVIAGTNPMINEVPSIDIGGTLTTNPMYGQLAQSNQGAYLPLFDIKSTSTMINTLGGYMGVTFSEPICAKITFDCGGHPYLIRLLCKRINLYLQEQGFIRPVEITEAVYEKVRPEFEKSSDAQGFYAMILLILQENYIKEYNVLKILATKDDRLISGTQDQNSLIHLLGYGLVDHNQGKYAIKFETVKRFLQGKYQFEVEGLSIEQKKAEIHLRCNNAETALRRVIRQTLLAIRGATKAKLIIIDAMKNNPASSPHVHKVEALDYSKLFDPSVNHGFFFSVLRDIICNHYDCFDNIFEGTDVSVVRSNLNTINNARRAPAHSYEESSENWTDAEFQSFRSSISWLENKLKPFEE